MAGVFPCCGDGLARLCFDVERLLRFLRGLCCGCCCCCGDGGFMIVVVVVAVVVVVVFVTSRRWIVAFDFAYDDEDNGGNDCGDVLSFVSSFSGT